MSEKNIAEMKWTEIPGETPLYEVLQAIGFPEPMIILKHLNKPSSSSKNAKKRDLSSVVTLLWMPFEDIRDMLENLYKSASRNTEVRQYLVNHPKQAMLLIQTYHQLQEESISTVAERNLKHWRTLLIEDDVWDNLMKETPITIAQKVIMAFTDTDYLNTTLGEYYEKFGAEEFCEKTSIKSIGNKFVEAEAEERRLKQFKKEMDEAGLSEFEKALRMAMFSRGAKDFPSSSKFDF